MINNYYVYFNLKDNINYVYLLKLYRLAQFNKDTRRYDIVKYDTLKDLAVSLDITASTLSTMLNSDKYNNYFSIDKRHKIISLHNNFSGSNTKPFIHLTASMVDYLLSVEAVNRNLFIKYFLYIKYYCSMYKNKPQDFTINQFLSFVSLSTKSTKYKNLIGDYNNILKQSGYVIIKPWIDNRGHSRNYYFFNYD